MICLKAIALSVLVTFGKLALAWPQPPLNARILEKQVDVRGEYDYIIVGGGTSALTVGDRLTENGKYSVLAIEQGLYHTQTGMSPVRMFNITSQPSPGLNGRTFSVGIGCAVGGSSIVNGQVMLRGTKDEYDAWKELGGTGSTWDWEHVLPYFRKGITLNPPASAMATEFNIRYDRQFWGNETPIYDTFGSARPSEVTKSLHAAMASMPGITLSPDSGSGQSGLYWYGTSHDPTTGLRSYARTGHWDRIPRNNYELVVGAKVNQILFEGTTATGVQFVSVNETSPQPIKVNARREVILAAGTIHTPQVLMLSGIGPRAHLQSVGINVKVDLPAVGANFQDHAYIPSIGYSWGRNPPGNTNPGGLTAAPNLVAMVSLPALSPDTYQDMATRYERQDPLSHLPSSYTAEQVEGYRRQQAVYARLMRSNHTNFNQMMMMGPGGSVQNMHTMSRGTVTLNQRNPTGEVLVDYRAGSNEIDLEVMAENIRFMRRYMNRTALVEFQPRELTPGASVSTLAQLIQWSKGQIIPSVYHPVGTCAKMPRELGGCVNEELLVHGTKKLSVIDASIMPTIVGANTQMTVYAVAERAADLIKERTFDKI